MYILYYILYRDGELSFTSGDVTYNLVPILALFFLLYLLRVGKGYSSLMESHF